MSDQPQPNGPQQQVPPGVTQIKLNGGVYPDENGTWRVCCWFSGMRTEAEAANISNWLAKLVQQHISPAPPPPTEAPPPVPQ